MDTKGLIIFEEKGIGNEIVNTKSKLVQTGRKTRKDGNNNCEEEEEENDDFWFLVVGK